MGKVAEGRRYCRLEIPTLKEEVFADILSADEVHFYEDNERTNEIMDGKHRVLELELPKEVKSLKLVKCVIPPICELGVNRKLWPIDEMVGMRIILDNRNINMINEEGNFREDKYRLLYNGVNWKKWALLVYEKKNGDLESTLFWKP